MALRLRARHGGAKVIPLVLRDGPRTGGLLVALLFIAFGWMSLHVSADSQADGMSWLPPAVGLFMLAGAACLLWQGFAPRREEVRIAPTTLFVRLQSGRYEAAWTEIADITVHDVPFWQRDQGSQPRVTVRLHAPSGAPLEWLTILDVYEIGRAELAAELRAGLAAAPPATQPRTYATAAVVIDRRDEWLMRFGALFALAPLLLGLAILLRAWLR
ncbi:hypothetical protein [Falsiroseomonas sp.]|uniref:hypothetical protein n=1 Tax=Falsiroseomonas sp. TaxID=2870721 RepID=UPI003F7212C0